MTIKPHDAPGVNPLSLNLCNLPRTLSPNVAEAQQFVCAGCDEPATTSLDWREDGQPIHLCNWHAYELRYSKMWRIKNLIARCFAGDSFPGEVITE
jgi:hypothetical protein